MAQEPEILLQAGRFSVVRVSRRLADGTLHRREIVEHPGAVVILPLLADGRVCLIRNYRMTVGETLWELPAGTLDSGEDPAETAHRELIEETGYRPGRMEKLLEFYTSPGVMTERMHLFLATDLTAGPADLEPEEEIETHLMSWDDALRLVDSGQMRDAKSLVALLMYDRMRAKQEAEERRK